MTLAVSTATAGQCCPGEHGMQCTSCGESNRADDSFCQWCGTPLEQTCVECHAALSPGARFCGKCGAAVHADDASPPTDGGTSAAAAPATQDVGKAEAPVPVAAGPYIDSDLCTTCNDCLKINPILFVYNADNQAKIGDPLSGTYAELVKAAEKCPARCIHPGTPRPEDKTATARMVSRGAKFD